MERLGLRPIRSLFACVALLMVAMGAARASEPAPALEAGIEQQVRSLALEATQHDKGALSRVDIEVGQLDARLHLAPCQRVQPYLPPGTRLWGKTRIGLRCIEGPTRWNVYLPITVKVFAKAWVAKSPLAVGAVISSSDLVQAEVDLAEDPSATMTDSNAIVGRTISRTLNAGQAVRLANVKPRQWFSAGDMVSVVGLGTGFSVSGEGQALTPGTEGQPARVRTESGRVLTGMPSGERRMELLL